MLVQPSIAALRRVPSLQRRTRAEMERALGLWKSGFPEVQRDLARFAAGEELARLSQLRALLCDHDCAAQFVDSFTTMFAEALQREPLSEVPCRHTSSAGFARLQLMQSGGAVLSLCVYEPREVSRKAQAAQFADVEAHELVLAGAAAGELHRLEQGRPVSERCNWRAGDSLTLQPQITARHFEQVDQSLLILQLTRTPERPQPTREYRLKDGALLRQISGDKRASEQVMALAVLGALGDRRAIDQMAEFARTRTFDAEARWEALRQVLALDAAFGLKLLNDLAADDGPLAKPAQELRAQIVANQPAFMSLEEVEA